MYSPVSTPSDSCKEDTWPSCMVAFLHNVLSCSLISSKDLTSSLDTLGQAALRPDEEDYAAPIKPQSAVILAFSIGWKGLLKQTLLGPVSPMRKKWQTIELGGLEGKGGWDNQEPPHLSRFRPSHDNVRWVLIYMNLRQRVKLKILIYGLVLNLAFKINLALNFTEELFADVVCTFPLSLSSGLDSPISSLWISSVSDIVTLLCN